MKNRWIRILLTFAAVLVLSRSASASTASWSYEQQKLKTGDFRIRSVCIMPAEGQLMKLGFKGGEGMAQQADPWTAALQNVVENHLKSAGIELLPASAALSSGASDDELHQVVLEIQEKFQAISDRLDKKPKDIGKSRYTLGDQVTLLPCAAKSDVLIFVKGQGDVVTKGQTTMGLLVGGPAFSSAVMIVTIADAKTGEIIAFMRLIDVGNFLNDSEKAFGQPLDHELSKMKIGAPKVVPAKAP